MALKINKSIAETGKIVFLICAAFTVAAGAYARFYRLDQIGLHGSDALYYTSIALAWSRGDFVYSIADQATVFRPVLHLLFAGALQIFGETDFAIKTLIASVDTINILLVIGLAWAISKSWSVSLASAITYAFLPMAIHLGRYELAHTFSTFFVLAAAIVLCRSWRSEFTPIRLLLVGASGALLSLAALTHEELLFLVPPFVAFVPAIWEPRATKTSWYRVSIEITVFCITPLICALVIVLQQPELIISAAKSAVAGDQFILEEFARFGWNGLLASSSALLAVFFLAALLLALLHLLRRLVTRHPRAGEINPLAYCGFVVFFVYIALSAFFFDTFFVRAFLPIVPFVIITTFVWAKWAAGKLRRTGGGIAIIVLAVLLVPFNLNNYRPLDFLGREFSAQWGHARLLSKASLVTSWNFFLRRNYVRKVWSAVYNAYRDKIGPESKLLITPSVVYPWPGRRALQSEIYFGDNAVYIFDHDEPLKELIKKYKIKYVLITPFDTRRPISRLTRASTYLYNGRWSPEQPIVLGASYGFGPGEYTIRKELHALYATLTSMGGRVVVKNASVMIIAL